MLKRSLGFIHMVENINNVCIFVDEMNVLDLIALSMKMLLTAIWSGIMVESEVVSTNDHAYGHRGNEDAIQTNEPDIPHSEHVGGGFYSVE